MQQFGKPEALQKLDADAVDDRKRHGRAIIRRVDHEPIRTMARGSRNDGGHGFGDR